MENINEVNCQLNICSKWVIVDYRTSKTTINELKNLGFKVVPTRPVKSLYNEVSGHSDMQIHIINNKAICEPSVYDYYKDKLNDVNVISGDKALTSKYPYDIAYNTCSIGKYAICKVQYTAKEIVSEYLSLKREILNAKQGYAKCSICVVNNESAITADEGMYKVLKEKNLNVLKIEPGCIKLYNMTGFIGGASGLLQKDLLAFNGEINTHPDSDKIVNFCKNVGVDIVSLNNDILTDIGSILVKRPL